MITKRIFFPLLYLFVGSIILSAQEVEKLDSTVRYMPKIEGTIRAKYEYNVSINQHRFMVRNARISATGNISPIISYKAEIDFSDAGKIALKNAWVRYTPTKGWGITFGQQKIPFSTEMLRSLHQYYFANRSFIGKQMNHDSRNVGIMVSCAKGKKLPFVISAGVYNGTALTDMANWQQHLNFTVRAELNPSKRVHLSLAMNSVEPQEIRMNLLNVNAFWEIGNMHLEGAYVYKYYAKNVHNDTHAVLAFACYDFLIPKVQWLHKISPVLRYDFMTDNHYGIANAEGKYITDDPYRQRITGGVTLSLSEPFNSDIRLNYEHNFYKYINSCENKLVLECCVRF